MEQRTLTLLDDGETIELACTNDGERIHLDPDALQRTLGWKLEPDGLCSEGVCIPIGKRDRDALASAGGLELGALAALLDRPLAFDADAGVAALGTSATERGRRLVSLAAPDFTLPDLTGELHSLSEHRGKKILLYMHASW